MSYSRLTQEERYAICGYLKSSFPVSKIALELQRHKSTIFREIKRNSGQCGYKAKQAICFAKERQLAKNVPRITADTWEEVCKNLRQKHSPEQISAVLKKENKLVSPESIYQYIFKDKKSGGNLSSNLRCQRKKKRRYAKPDRRGQLINRVSIDERPDIVATRTRLGDWEADTVETYKGGEVFVTLLERYTRLYLFLRIPNKKAITVKNGIIRLLSNINEYVKTITFDNGKEFAYHEEIGKELDAKCYFAHPYHSWERGSNENSNGLLRQYFPKGKDTKLFSDRDIAEIALEINKRPRKCIDFQTPYKLFAECMQGVALAT